MSGTCPRCDQRTGMFSGMGLKTAQPTASEVEALRTELAEMTNRLGGLLFSGALDNFTGADVKRWRDEFAAKYVLRADGGCKVPDGWKLVPVEPNNNMLHAFMAHYHAQRRNGVVDREAEDNAYRAMLTAAPSPSGDEESK